MKKIIENLDGIIASSSILENEDIGEFIDSSWSFPDEGSWMYDPIWSSLDDNMLDNVELEEALLTLAGRKNGQVLILAGGGGSGKGFILNKLIGFEGKVFNVDRLKELALKYEKFHGRIKKEIGRVPKSLDDMNADELNKIHLLLKRVGWDQKMKDAFLRSAIGRDKSKLPNIIFDVTLRQPEKLIELSSLAQKAGYDVKDINIVWILSTFDAAKANNASRSRSVGMNVLRDTHIGVSNVMNSVLMDVPEMSRKYVDGEIYIVFNLKDVDNKFIGKTVKKHGEKDFIGFFKNAFYVKLKAKGKSVDKQKVMKYSAKIDNYIPDAVKWREK